MNGLPDNRLSWPMLWLWLGFGAVAAGSCRGWGVVGEGSTLGLFWFAAGSSAAAFQVGVAPRQAGAGREALPPLEWLLRMCGMGAAVAFGGVVSVLASGAFMNAHGGQPFLLNAGIGAVVLGPAWMLGAVLLIVLKIVSAVARLLRPATPTSDPPMSRDDR